jgi:hypothetical protein
MLGIGVAARLSRINCTSRIHDFKRFIIHSMK